MDYSKNSNDNYTKFIVEPGKSMDEPLAGNLGLTVELKADKVKQKILKYQISKSYFFLTHRAAPKFSK